VVGHADWHAGNLRFHEDRLVAAYDWSLVAGTEPMIAGLSAGSYLTDGSSTGGLPTPDEVAAFLVDYDHARRSPFTVRQQRVAAASATWVLAYNARCHLSVAGPAAPALDTIHRDRDRYLDLRW
jgi:hypothetical protein